MSPNTWDDIRRHIASRIRQLTQTTVDFNEIVIPPDPKFGDLAFSCFALAKKLRRAPDEIARELAVKLNVDDFIAASSALGPYLNISLKSGPIIAALVQEIEAAKTLYGSSNDGKGRSLMLEYAQPNTHKEVHVGHLRNLVLGASLVRLLQYNGWKTVAVSYHGDVGAHVAKCLWMLVHKNSAEPDKVIKKLDKKMVKKILDGIPDKLRTGKYLGALYAEAAKIPENNQKFKDQVSLINQKLEAHDPAWEAMWQETREWSLQEFHLIFKELEVKLERQYFEHDMVEPGQRLVDELLKKKIAKKSRGAVVIDLEKDGLGIFLIRKSDGTALYSTKDLALAQKKFKDFPGLESSMILVDSRQSLYFKQLFRSLELMNLHLRHEFVGFEFVRLKTGVISSREGQVVSYALFRDEVMEFAQRETLERHPDWPNKKIKEVARAITLAGIKYGMLKIDPDKVLTFELERALSFDGDTGPYIQYAVIRLGNILKKANWHELERAPLGDLHELTERVEILLALQLAIFPEACRRAALELKPSILAAWCFSTAQRVNDFYRDAQVLEAREKIRLARLRIVAAAHLTLKKGLELLGISVPNEM